MNPVDSTRLLLEMRALAVQANAAALAPSSPGVAATSDFGSAMRAAVESVNALQGSARAAAAAFEAGEAGADLTGVMLEVQKAGLAFKAMVEVRNRLVSAYQEIMSMPV